MTGVRFIVWPLLQVVNIIVRFIKVFMPKAHAGFYTAQEELRGTISLRPQEGGFFKKDRDMLGGILSLSDLTVGDVMLHRKNIFSINVEQNGNIAMQQLAHNMHTRVPLWRDNPENIVGILHVKDFISLSLRQNYDMKTLLSPPLHVNHGSYRSIQNYKINWGLFCGRRITSLL